MSISLFRNKSTSKETKPGFVSCKVRYTHKKGTRFFSFISHEYGAGDFLFYLFGRECGEWLKFAGALHLMVLLTASNDVICNFTLKLFLEHP